MLHIPAAGMTIKVVMQQQVIAVVTVGGIAKLLEAMKAGRAALQQAIAEVSLPHQEMLNVTV